MAKSFRLYRRPSGIYVLRIAVPSIYAGHLGQKEIHISSKTNCLSSARHFAAVLECYWENFIRDWRSTQLSDIEFLSSRGFISLFELSQALKISVDRILREIINNNIPATLLASSVYGITVDDHTQLDREDGSIILNSVREFGSHTLYTGPLKPFNTAHAIIHLIEHGEYEEYAFKIPNKGRAAFFPEPKGIAISAKSLLILKIHTLRLFPHLSPASNVEPVSPKKTAEESGVHSSAQSEKLEISDFCNPRHAGRKVSQIINLFIEQKRADRKISQQKKNGFDVQDIYRTNRESLPRRNR